MAKPEPQPVARPHRRKSRVAATLKALLRTRIMAGLLVVLPIYVTIWLLTVVFRLMRDSSLWVVEAYLRSRLGEGLLERWQVPKPAGYATWPEAKEAFKQAGVTQIPVTERLDFLEFRLGHPPEMQDFFDLLPATVQWGTAIVAVLLTIIILYAIGLFAANLLGRRVINAFESALDKVPLVKTVYRSTKQILATFAGEQSHEFQRAALVPFPQEKMRCVGFITAIFNDSVTGEELATVFIPTTPNPTTGYLQILKRKELVELDWSVEDAVRTIMSGGILRPEFLTIVPGTRPAAALPETRQPELGPPPDERT
jgi:uncharacterized membrane protein